MTTLNAGPDPHAAPELHTAPELLRAPELRRAWSGEVPGPMAHPGPRHNIWPGPAAVVATPDAPVPVLAMLRALWWSEEWHPDPSTGLPGRIRRRGVPSAGACYPVQSHVVCGEGCDVPPGLYAYDAVRNVLVQRSPQVRPGGTGDGGRRGAVVVFTVLPQRTAAKYHHRSWPLLIADTAYAVMGLAHHAAARRVGAAWLGGDPSALAAVLGLPVYAEWQALWRDTGPEVPLAAVALGGARPAPPGNGILPVPDRLRPAPQPGRQPCTVDSIVRGLQEAVTLAAVTLTGTGSGVSAAMLAARRSAAPWIREPIADPGHRTGAAKHRIPAWRNGLAAGIRSFPLDPPAGCGVLQLEREELRNTPLSEHCAGQEWIRQLDGLLLFRSPPGPLNHGHMWWASALAAHLLYRGLDRPGTAFRPVGGWTGLQDGHRTLHGLGVLELPHIPAAAGSGHSGRMHHADQ